MYEARKRIELFHFWKKKIGKPWKEWYRMVGKENEELPSGVQSIPLAVLQIGACALPKPILSPFTGSTLGPSEEVTGTAA
jgi:hypothetical protein